jgi:hypothetical protein
MADDHRRRLLALLAASPLPMYSLTRKKPEPAVEALPSMAALARQAIPSYSAIVLVAGYYRLGDGGGGNFIWDSESHAVHDGGAIVLPSTIKNTDSGRWLRLIDTAAVNVRWWGAHEDEGNNAPHINAAIHYLSKKGGGEVHGSGRFSTTEPINVPDFVTLRGLGRMGLILLPRGQFHCIQVHGDSYKAWGNQRGVIGVAIDGTHLRGNGLDIRYCGLRCYFADILIQSCQGLGLRIEGSFDHKYERIECRGNVSYGIEVMEKQAPIEGVYEEVSRLRFDHVDAVANNTGGVQWNQAGGDNCEWIGCKASEGSVGIHFSRNGCKHTLMDIHCDGNGVDTSIIQINAPWAQDITIISVRGWRTKFRVNIVEGRNIQVREASDIAPVPNGVDVVVATTANGDVRIAPNITFRDNRVYPKTYPEDARAKWNPISMEIGGNPSFATAQADYTQNGHVITFWIKLVVGKTGIRKHQGLSLILPTLQADDSLGVFNFTRDSGMQLSGVVRISNRAIVFPGEFLAMIAAEKFEWTLGDELTVSGTYNVP